MRDNARGVVLWALLGVFVFAPVMAQQYPGGYGAGPNPQTESNPGGGDQYPGQEGMRKEGAQEGQGEENAQEGQKSEESKEPEGNESQPSAVEEPSGPMSLADAKINFAAVVQGYLADKSSGGYWPLRSKGRTMRLRLQGVDEASIRRVAGNYFRGQVRFLDSNGRRFSISFTVDFSPHGWRVVKVGGPASRAKKKRRAAPPPAASQP